MRLSCGHMTEAFGTKTNSKRQEGCGACSESAEVIRWALQPPNRTLIPSALLCTGQENAGSRRDNAMRKLHNMYTHIKIFLTHTHTHTQCSAATSATAWKKCESSERAKMRLSSSFEWRRWLWRKRVISMASVFQSLWIFIQVWPLTPVWGQEASFKSEHL